ncbi:MAG: peptidoglycan recognition protein family protein [Bdellovibrionota bacterium]
MKPAHLLFLACLLSQSANAAWFRFLGAKTYSDENNKSIQMPDGSPVEITNLNTDPLQATFVDPLDYKSHTLKIPRSDLKVYFDVSSASFRAYFEPTMTAIGLLNGPPLVESCADEFASACNVKGNENNTRRPFLASLLVSCTPTADPEIVKRNDVYSTEDFRKSCAEQTAATQVQAPGTWNSPKPPPYCTEEEKKILLKNEEKKHAAYLASCPAHEPNLGKLGLAPQPECLLPAERSQIKKIVLHSSEGSPIASPKALYCDYLKQGFQELPYHFYVAKDRSTGQWRIYEGRSLKYQGAHVRAKLNSDSIGIAIAGDYQPGGPTPAHPFAKSEAPPAEAVQLVQSLVVKLKKQFPEISNIQGHGEALFEGDHCLKDCPGPGAQFVVHRLREKFFPQPKAKEGE